MKTEWPERNFGKLHSLHRPDELLQFKIDLLQENHETLQGVIAVIFANPADIVASKEIFPKLNYLHYRSGDFLDFAVAGMVPDHQKSDYLLHQIGKAFEVDGRQWYFSEFAFVKVVSYFERNSSWRHMGESDLLILDYKIINQKFKINWGNALQVNLQKAIRLGAIDSVSSFLEKLIHFAKDNQSEFDSSNISKEMLLDKGKNSLIDLLGSTLPKGIYESFKKLEIFVPLDLNKRAT